MYIIAEIQTNTDGTIDHKITTHASRGEAESKYHAVLSEAAISEYAVHTAVMYNNYGQDIKAQYYEHVKPRT